MAKLCKAKNCKMRVFENGKCWGHHHAAKIPLKKIAEAKAESDRRFAQMRSAENQLEAKAQPVENRNEKPDWIRCRNMRVNGEYDPAWPRKRRYEWLCVNLLLLRKHRMEPDKALLGIPNGLWREAEATVKSIRKKHESITVLENGKTTTSWRKALKDEESDLGHREYVVWSKRDERARKKQRNRCTICGEKLPEPRSIYRLANHDHGTNLKVVAFPANLQHDHFVPRSLGSFSAHWNYPTLVHSDCNGANGKHHLTHEDPRLPARIDRVCKTRRKRAKREMSKTEYAEYARQMERLKRIFRELTRLKRGGYPSETVELAKNMAWSSYHKDKHDPFHGYPAADAAAAWLERAKD